MDIKQPESHLTPGLSDPRQDNPLWLQLWQDQDIEFHQTQVNALLTRFWPTLNLPRASRILVPLCGKSLDMLWLAQQGYQVIGIELSPIATKAFFVENHLKPSKQRIGNFTRWQCGRISIWCGDLFSLNRGQLGHIDSVFDRAALTALPKAIRQKYVAQIQRLITADTSVFLLTVEDGLPSQAAKPAPADIDHEILTLYGDTFDISLCHAEAMIETGPIADHQQVPAQGKVYHLTARLSLPPPLPGHKDPRI